MDINSLSEILSNNETSVSKVISCNSYTQKFALSLTEDEANSLVLAKKETLKDMRRIEFGESILPKLIFAFCDSPFIYRDNYVATLEQLQEIFYHYKNETNDEVTDDELIDYMRIHFNGDCQGSLEFLEETILDDFARVLRSDIDWYRLWQETKDSDGEAKF